jgi:hypothetical protein
MPATLTLKGNKDRLIPVLTDKTCRVSTLTAVGPLKYYHYLEVKKLQQEPDRHFIECFVDIDYIHCRFNYRTITSTMHLPPNQFTRYFSAIIY